MVICDKHITGKFFEVTVLFPRPWSATARRGLYGRRFAAVQLYSEQCRPCQLHCERCLLSRLLRPVPDYYRRRLSGHRSGHRSGQLGWCT